MMVFWVIAAVLMLLALFFLLPPLLLRKQARDLLARDELNVTIFKDQLAELETDLSAGILTQEQYDIARHDLERNFIQDNGENESQTVSQTDRIVGRATAVVIAVVVPIASIVIYNLLGSGEPGLNPHVAQEAEQQIIRGNESSETLQEALVALQSRLESNPEDVESWVMLGRSHYFLNQYLEASDAFAQASILLGDSNPDVLADYADALAMANDRNMLGRPYELLMKALSVQPFHEKSLWMAGVAAYQAQDMQSTLQYWEQLLTVMQPGSPDFVQMQENVNEIRASLGLPVTSTEGPVAAESKASISGSVRLDESIAAQAAPDDTVFIFARAVEGPRMPLAILRVQVKDLPMEFTLDDSMAMSPQMTLSNFAQVVVGARVSRAGNAMPQSGDLEGSSEPLDVNEAGSIELVINSVVP